MSEWKVLKIDNLPPNMLIDIYEFEKQYDTQGKTFAPINWKPIEILMDLYKYKTIYRYRKPEPKAPTHEEIMTKWWKDEGGDWVRVNEYCDGCYAYYSLMNSHFKGNFVDRLRKDKDWFIDRESEVIPPEC